MNLLKRIWLTLKIFVYRVAQPVILSAQGNHEDTVRQRARRTPALARYRAQHGASVSAPIGIILLLWQRFFGAYSWRVIRKFKERTSE
jgi:hypothetical protein